MRQRYSRQIFFPPVGQAGQERIRRSSVLVVGAGALGSVLANNMARAGVGRLRIVDRDFVEESNLQRQILYDEEDAAQTLPKAVAAVEKLRKINSEVDYEPVVADVNSTNVEELLTGFDLVLDGADNFEVRMLINDACVKHGVPWIHGACVGSQGLSFDVLPGETPCFRCIYQDSPPPGSTPTCDTAGVIAPIVNIIASIQSAEALKLLVGDQEHLSRDLVSVDVWENSFERIDLSNARRPECPACGERRFEFLEAKRGWLSMSLCGRDAIQVAPPPGGKVDLVEVAQRLSRLGEVSRNPFLLRFQADGREMVLFGDGRAVIKGTNDEAAARSFYAKYVGM
ncbi:MAG: ThiF family adenylyltransferase [Syntrophothermus sp.]